MPLVSCPNPSCDHEVVDNWLSCPKCRCPVQVLRAAQAAKEAEAAAAAAAEAELEDEEARLEAEKPSGKMLEKLRKASTEDEERAPEEDPEVEPEPPAKPRNQLVDQLGTIMGGAGGLAALGVPLNLDHGSLATGLGITAVVCVAASVGLKKLAEEMGSSR